jgi:bifunctional hydroxylase/dehydrase
LFAVPGAGSLAADEVSGLALRYPFGDGSPEPAGRLLPVRDLRLPGEDGPPRGLLRDGRGLLLTSAAGLEHRAVASRWTPRVDIRDAGGAVDQDYLIRPDGYVAWTSRAAEPLSAALERWFGYGL